MTLSDLSPSERPAPPGTPVVSPPEPAVQGKPWFNVIDDEKVVSSCGSLPSVYILGGSNRVAHGRSLRRGRVVSRRVAEVLVRRAEGPVRGEPYMSTERQGYRSPTPDFPEAASVGAHLVIDKTEWVPDDVREAGDRESETGYYRCLRCGEERLDRDAFRYWCR